MFTSRLLNPASTKTLFRLQNGLNAIHRPLLQPVGIPGMRLFSTSGSQQEKYPRRARRQLRKERLAQNKRNVEEKKRGTDNNQPQMGLGLFWETFKSNIEKVREEQEKALKNGSKNESKNDNLYNKEQKNVNRENDASDSGINNATSSGGSNGNDGGNKNNRNKKNDDKDNARKVIDIEINMTQLTWGILALFFIFSFLSPSEVVPEITFQDFKNQILNRGDVSKLQVVNKSMVRVFTRSGGDQCTAFFTIGSVDSFERLLVETQDKLGVKPADRIPVGYIDEGSWVAGVMSLAPTLLFLGFLVYIGRRAVQRSGGGGVGGVFGVGKTKAQLYNPNTDVKVRFSDVAGMNEAKTEIMEFVQFLKTPEKYENLGAKIPRGAILSGAPGTGKTLLAKATAGEAGVPFFSVSGSEFVEMFSGVGASRVRDLFKKAKEKAPAMIWIDEIDAIGKARAGAGMRGGNDEREATLNQLLVEMDGFGSDEHVIVLAGTNRPDMLDKALLRPGRFDRHISIDLPTLEGRKEIYGVHLNKIEYDKDIPELPGKLAAMTPGFSGADIANCCNEAALAAARVDAKVVEMEHFEKAIDRVIAGLERRSRVLPTDKRRIVAYHEAGHAVAGWFLKYADPLVKVTIVPHGAAALGYAQLLPSDATITTENRMQDLMTVALGGRCSEEIFFDTVTVGASDDFKRITQIAKGMVCDYGFSSKVGTVRLERPQGAVQKPYSEATDVVIDEEVRKIIESAHTTCKNLLTEKKDLVARVAEELLSKEQLTRQDLVRLLGERPYKSGEHEAFKKYLDVNDK